MGELLDYLGLMGGSRIVGRKIEGRLDQGIQKSESGIGFPLAIPLPPLLLELELLLELFLSRTLLKEVRALVVLLLLATVLWVEEEWSPPVPVVLVVPLETVVMVTVMMIRPPLMVPSACT